MQALNGIRITGLQRDARGVFRQRDLLASRLQTSSTETGERVYRAYCALVANLNEPYPDIGWNRRYSGRVQCSALSI